MYKDLLTHINLRTHRSVLKVSLGLYVNICSLKAVSCDCQLNPYPEHMAWVVVFVVLYQFFLRLILNF